MEGNVREGLQWFANVGQKGRRRKEKEKKCDTVRRTERKSSTCSRLRERGERKERKGKDKFGRPMLWGEGGREGGKSKC